MRLLLLICAMVWPSGQAMAAACGTGGFLISGFDAAGSCTGVAETGLFSSSHTLVTVTSGTYTGVSFNPEGNQYGRIIFSANASQLTLTAANFPAGVGTDWSSHDFVYFAYATTRTTASFFTSEYHILNGATDLYFSAAGSNVSKAAYAATTDWTPLILSMNYARNLGYAPNSVSSISIRQKGSVSSPFEIGYDDLTLQDGGNTPNTPLTSGDVSVVAACTSHNVTLTPQTQTGTDIIAGYHVYRSTNGPAGPYVSHRYLAQGATPAWTEIAPFFNNVYYKVLPYSISTTAFLGGASGYFVKGANSLIDPANASALGGVHEDLLSNAPAIGPFNQSSACTPTFSPTSSHTPTMTTTPTATSTATETSTVTPSSTVTPTSTSTSTVTPTSTATPTSTDPPSATQSVTPPGTLTNTPTPSLTITPTSSATAPFSFTSTQTQTLLPTNSFTVSPTPTMSFTPSPVVSPTFNPNSGAQLFPNPFHPDQGETFHLGNVQPGLRVNIYNIIGEFVIGFTTKGNPTEDRWDSLNANGVRVVTGIYFLQIDGKVYRVAVVRD